MFVRHRWARRYILRVLDDGTLRVTLPRWGSKSEAPAFVEQSGAWIAKQRLSTNARPAVVHPDEAELRRRAAKELPRGSCSRWPPPTAITRDRGSRSATSDRDGARARRADRSRSTGG